METSSLRDNFKIDGKWWLPNKKDQQLPGTLTFLEGTTIELILIGRFPASDDERHEEVLLGESHLGTEVTVFDVICKEDAPAPIGRLTYAINYMFIGRHYPNIEALEFKSLILESEVITDWIADSKPIPKIEENEIVWTRASERIVHLPIAEENFDLSLYPTLSFRRRKAVHEVAEFYKLSINAKTNQPFHVLYDWLIMICSFFEILIYEPIDYLRIHLVPPNSDPAWGTAGHVQFFLAHSTPSRLDAHRMELPEIPHSLIARDLPNMVEKWCANYDHAFTSIDLLIGSYYETSRHSRYTFLMLVQCLESLQIPTSAGVIMDKAKFNSLFGRPLLLHAREIQKSVPEIALEVVRAILSKIKEANRKPLRGRMEDLLGKLDSKAVTLVLRSQPVSEFIPRMVDTRNVLSHGLERSRKTLSDIELQVTNKQLQLLARLLVVELLMSGPTANIAEWMDSSFFGKTWKRQFGGPFGKPVTGLAGKLLGRFGL